jgi:hypothetical protein
MSAKAEIRNIEARKKSEKQKRKSVAPSPQRSFQSDNAEVESFGIPSSEFFRNSEFGIRVSTESPLKEFNSEF